MNPDDESEYGQMTPEQQANSDATNASVKSPSFKDAFSSARAGGDKTFTWNGKSYTTQLASEKPKTVSTESAQVTAKEPEPSFEDRVAAIKEAKGYTSPSARIPQGSSSGNKGPGGQSNATTSTESNIYNNLDAFGGLGKMAGALGLVGELGSRAAKAIKATGKGTQAVEKVAEVASKGREAVTNPTAWTGGPKAMKTIQKVEDAANKVADKAAKVARTSKKRTEGNIPDSVTNGGAVGYRKGGVIASRGDGIARKGHTKGKYL